MSIVDSSFVFLVAGIKKMAGTILVYVYAALFLPCSLRVALFFFCSFLFWVFLWFSGLVLLLSFSHCVLFLSLGFYFVFALVLLPSLLPLLCSAFYKAQRACPYNQSWLCRTVIPPRTGLWAENVVTIGSALLLIFQLPCWIGMKKTHDCSPATVPFRQKWKYSLWPLNSLNLTIGILIKNNWFLIMPLD